MLSELKSRKNKKVTICLHKTLTSQSTVKAATLVKVQKDNRYVRGVPTTSYYMIH